MSIAEQWSTFFLGTPYDHLPADVASRRSAPCSTSWASRWAGRACRWPRSAPTTTPTLAAQPEASLLLDTRRVPAIHAAFVNGVYGHALDMDDGHRMAAGHPASRPSRPRSPPPRSHQSSGRDLLRAIVCRLRGVRADRRPPQPRPTSNAAFTPPPPSRRSRRPPPCGLLLGLDAERLTRALGLAGLQGAGLMEVFHDGAMAKPFQTATGGAAGLLAAELAARGADGPRTILEGEQGFLAAMCGDREAPERLVGRARGGLGDPGHLLQGVRRLPPHPRRRRRRPRCSATSTPCAPSTSSASWCGPTRSRTSLCGATALPSGPSEAKFSLPFTIALGLTVRPRRASPASRRRPSPTRACGALASRVRVEVDPALERACPVKSGVDPGGHDDGRSAAAGRGAVRARRAGAPVHRRGRRGQVPRQRPRRPARGSALGPSSPRCAPSTPGHPAPACWTCWPAEAHSRR